MTYHDLYITTPTIERKRLFDLPMSYMLTCTRAAGWELWDAQHGIENAEYIAGEYHDEKWLVLDVNGHVILDSREKNGTNPE